MFAFMCGFDGWIFVCVRCVFSFVCLFGECVFCLCIKCAVDVRFFVCVCVLPMCLCVLGLRGARVLCVVLVCVCFGCVIYFCLVCGIVLYVCVWCFAIL